MASKLFKAFRAKKRRRGKRKSSVQRSRRNVRTPTTMVESGVQVMYGAIGIQVATARRNRSQKEIAKKAGVTQGQVSNLERGKATMSRQVAEKIFKAVGMKNHVKIADLFDALKAFSKAHRL